MIIIDGIVRGGKKGGADLKLCHFSMRHGLFAC